MSVVIIIGLALLLVVVAVVMIYRESKEFCMTFYEYSSDKLLKDSYKIIVLADLHNKVFGDCNAPLLDAIDEWKPDAVIFAGDMMTSSMEVKYDNTPSIDFITKLSEKYPIYYGMGNHEEKFKRRTDKFADGYKRYEKELEKCGVHIMENETACIEEAGIMIYGLMLDWHYYRRFWIRHIPDEYMQNMFGTPRKDKYSILLAHNPEHFQKYAAWGPDLVLSGHLHGGVMQLPLLGGVISPQFKLFPKYDAGEFKEKNSTMLVSRGIGSHTIPLRIWNRAEMIGITLKKK